MQGFVQPCSVCFRSTCCIGEDSFAAKLLERVLLKVEGLLKRGNAGVANKHNLSQPA
jgi:hypothetical protein